MKQQTASLSFKEVCKAKGWVVEPEYRFAAPRRWRFDYALPAYGIALEVEGGVWTGGRHTSAAGYAKDLEKYNAATILGWRILRVQPRELLTLAPILIEAAISVTPITYDQPAATITALPDIFTSSTTYAATSGQRRKKP